ncbi:MAG: DNRLRE domain-containing protein [Anaerolineae bacterium]
MNTIQVSKKLIPAAVVLLAAVATVLLITNRLTSAAPTNSATLTAVQDSYTDLNLASANFDGGLLNAANSSGGPEDPDLTTKYIFVEFDLSGVTFSINSATLELSTLTCGGTLFSDDVDVVVYGVDNSVNWSESALTWNNQPAPTTGALIGLDAGVIPAGTAQTVRWTDYAKGALSAWLESQRAANDGSATLALAIDNSGNPGLADVFFEDSEGSGAVANCADAGASPTLTVSETATYFVYLPAVLK